MDPGCRRSFGVIGLGKMGGGIAKHALGKGFRVVGLDKKPPTEKLGAAGLQSVPDVAALARALEPPRIVLLYLPAGQLVDAMIDQLSRVFENGDIIADGGNSYWGDSIRRHAHLKASGIRFIDLGTSGGPGGALNGACFMAGGDTDGIEKIEPILRNWPSRVAMFKLGDPVQDITQSLCTTASSSECYRQSARASACLSATATSYRPPRSLSVGGMAQSSVPGSSI